MGQMKLFSILVGLFVWLCVGAGSQAETIAEGETGSLPQTNDKSLSDDTSQSILYGAWTLIRNDCATGNQWTRQFDPKQGDVSQFTFDKTGKSKWTTSMRGCKTETESETTIEGNELTIGMPLVVKLNNCKLSFGASKYKFEMRKLPNGDDALVLSTPLNYRCDPKGTYELWLTRSPAPQT